MCYNSSRKLIQMIMIAAIAYVCTSFHGLSHLILARIPEVGAIYTMLPRRKVRPKRLSDMQRTFAS